jgi:hypothetical protein
MRHLKPACLLVLCALTGLSGCRAAAWPWSSSDTGPSAVATDDLGAAPSPEALSNTLADAQTAARAGDWPTHRASYSGDGTNGQSLSDAAGYGYAGKSSAPAFGGPACADGHCTSCK